MLRFTADVNGRPIGYVFIHNTGKVTKENEYLYNAATWSDGDGIFGIENVPHVRSDPWPILLFRVLRCVVNRD